MVLAVSDEDDSDFDGVERDVLLSFVAIVGAGLWTSTKKRKKRGTHGPTIKRVRHTVDSIMYELGYYKCRFYRMSEDSFWALYRLLKPKLQNPSQRSLVHDDAVRNGSEQNQMVLSTHQYI